MKGKGMPVKHLRCDNTGERQKKLKRICERHGVDIEYTPPHTPQMNGVAERRIA
jgi:transposase